METLTVPTFAAMVLQGAESAAPEEGSSPFGSPLFLVAVLAVLFYVVMLGPERKQRKRREAMLGALKKGDRVVTSSGLHASVAVVADDVVTLQVADGVRLKFTRSAIQTVVEAETENGKGKATKEAKGEAKAAS